MPRLRSAGCWEGVGWGWCAVAGDRPKSGGRFGRRPVWGDRSARHDDASRRLLAELQRTRLLVELHRARGGVLVQRRSFLFYQRRRWNGDFAGDGDGDGTVILRRRSFLLYMRVEAG